MTVNVRIGIDPGSRKSGIAIMIDGELFKLFMANFIELCSLIETDFKKYVDYKTTEIIYHVEDVNMIRPTWVRPDLTFQQKMKISQDVGMVKLAGKYIVDQININLRQLILVRPLKGFLKRFGKNSTGAAKFFSRLMRWDGRSNEHTRDAALLLLPYLKIR